jgi:hypothetical protein
LLALGELHKKEFPGAISMSELDVQVRTLDGELGDAALPGPVLLKLDVQGYERWVLEGGQETLRRTKWLIMEVSFRSLYDGEPSFMELLTFVAELGFRFERPVGWLAAPSTGEILQCDALLQRA